MKRCPYFLFLIAVLPALALSCSGNDPAKDTKAAQAMVAVKLSSDAVEEFTSSLHPTTHVSYRFHMVYHRFNNRHCSGTPVKTKIVEGLYPTSGCVPSLDGSIGAYVKMSLTSGYDVEHVFTGRGCSRSAGFGYKYRNRQCHSSYTNPGTSEMRSWTVVKKTTTSGAARTGVCAECLGLVALIGALGLAI